MGNYLWVKISGSMAPGCIGDEGAALLQTFAKASHSLSSSEELGVGCCLRSGQGSIGDSSPGAGGGGKRIAYLVLPKLR